MKKYIVILFLFTTLITLADGGGSGSPTLFINDYESQFNMYYKSVEDSVKYFDEKGKLRFMRATTNIALYDITNDKAAYLFSDSLNEMIVGFAFETYYNNSERTMVLNVHYTYGYYWQAENNFDITERKPSDKILITTYSLQTKKYTLWISDKSGSNLRKQYVFGEVDHVDIDIRNSCVRLFVPENNKITITNLKY